MSCIAGDRPISGNSSWLLAVAALLHRNLPGCSNAPTNHRNQIVEVEWLRQIFERAARSLHGGEQSALRAHHDYPQLRPDLADARDQIQSVLVGHHHVGDDDVALSVRNPSPQRSGVTGYAT